MNNAILSDCGTYRYRLDRDVDGGDLDIDPVIAFFGINPSTADASLDDQTVKKWNGFTKRWGAARYIVGNVFAYRATDVRELKSVTDPLGPLRDQHLADIIHEADILVPCWGNSGKVPKELRWAIDDLKECLLKQNKQVLTFGFTKGGDPKHPMMLGYDTKMKEWETA